MREFEEHPTPPKVMESEEVQVDEPKVKINEN
jgi:hypothetical protein